MFDFTYTLGSDTGTSHHAMYGACSVPFLAFRWLEVMCFVPRLTRNVCSACLRALLAFHMATPCHTIESVESGSNVQKMGKFMKGRHVEGNSACMPVNCGKPFLKQCTEIQSSVSSC